MSSSASGSGGSTDWVSRLQDLQDGGDIGSALEKALVLPIIAFTLQLANVLEAVLDLFIVPLRSFIDGIGAFIASLFGTGDTFGIADVLSAGSAESARSIADGPFNILSLPVAVFVVLLSGVIVAWYLSREETSDLIPFAFTDFPLVGTEEEE